MDDPAATVLEPQPVARPAPETLRQSLRGVRQALFGIELTLLALLLVLLAGPTGLAALVAFGVAIVGLVAVLGGLEG